MSIISRPADNGSVRAGQAAAAAVLVKFLTYDLPVLTWRIYDRQTGLIGQMDDDGRGDEQLSSYLAMWAELIDGDFFRMPMLDGEKVQWKVSGVYAGVPVEVWTFVSVAFDAAHDLPTMAVAEAAMEAQAEELYAETMLTAAERFEQTRARVRAGIDRPGSLLHATDAELAEFAEASERSLQARAAGR